MDFSTLNTRKAAAQGAFLHLLHPGTGKAMFTDAGEAIGLTVIGTESDAVRNAVRQAQRNRVKDATEKGEDFLVSLVTGFHHIVRDGVTLDCTPENVRWILDLSDSFGEQILAFASDRANFFRG
jgi:hypothetical protein